MAILKLVFKKCLKNRTTYAFCFTFLIIFTVYYLFLNSDTFLWNIQKPPEHVLCVLVPFRNVFEELHEFIPFMSAFLNRQSIKFHFVVVNHVPDENRFNKGVTFNAGFEIISKKYPDCDYTALHDIDILPLNDNISYGHPGDDVNHVTGHRDLHPPRNRTWDNRTHVGAIVIISNNQYLRINGFGNNFWGWGEEGRNFYCRMKNNSINLVRSSNLAADRSKNFKNIHSPCRIRDKKKCGNQKLEGIELAETDFDSGLNDMKYNLTSVNSITFDEIPVTMFSISIPCDYSKTPWCKTDCIDNT